MCAEALTGCLDAAELDTTRRVRGLTCQQKHTLCAQTFQFIPVDGKHQQKKPGFAQDLCHESYCHCRLLFMLET